MPGVELQLQVARLLCGPDVLLTAYAGDQYEAARMATGTGFEIGSRDLTVMVARSGNVTYRSTADKPLHQTTMRAIVRLAVTTARKGAVDRLAAAVTARRRAMAACERYVRGHGGGGVALSADQAKAPEWTALVDVMDAAHREVDAAHAAWWDGAADGEQLDLFGAVGGR